MAQAKPDKFTETRLAILQAIVSDPTLRDYAARLGSYLLSGYVSREVFEETGQLQAWPSQKRIAEETGSTINSVRRAGHELSGYLVIAAGRGARINSVYTFRRPDEKPCVSEGISEAKPQRKPPLSGAPKPITNGAENPSQGTPETPHRPPTNPLIEPFDEPIEVRRPKRRSALPADRPDQRDMLWAKSRIGPAINLDAEAERFRDWHLAKATLSADWAANWRTWVGRIRPPGQVYGRPQQQSELEHALETFREH